jgi:hypothetical protein
MLDPRPMQLTREPTVSSSRSSDVPPPTPLATSTSVSYAVRLAACRAGSAVGPRST